MAAVLLMVGRGLEQPDVVARLLEADTKPQYTMAPEVGSYASVHPSHGRLHVTLMCAEHASNAQLSCLPSRNTSI